MIDRSRGEPIRLERDGAVRYRIPAVGEMRVPGVVFASELLIPDVEADQSLKQVANVATLCGIVRASYAMPDVHWGYGFPIGGVAATDVEEGGVISPGGVGFDISCGVRVLVTDLECSDSGAHDPTIAALLNILDEGTPRGLGKGGVWELPSQASLPDVLERGALAAIEAGFGTRDDLDRCEDRGGLAGASIHDVSQRAMERGLGQIGSLGSGNHFIEIQVVERVHRYEHASAFGLTPGRVCVMLHTGSRGLGHQVCTDHVRQMQHVHAKYAIRLPDSQLACVPVRSPEGEAYLGAMIAAANYGRANRQALTHAVRRAVEQVEPGVTTQVLYDVSHNLAKLEYHGVDGKQRLLCVHRKGATRALPPGHPDLPPDLKPWGQPVLIPGSMGTSSWVLAGMDGNPAFNSAPHGAGRRQSRHAARKRISGQRLQEDLARAGIEIRPRSLKALAEEAPFAYKDVDEVIRVTEEAGLATAVARLVPVGVVKG